jgi:hypothetical protein
MCRMHVGATASARHCSQHSHTWSQEQVPTMLGAKTRQIAVLTVPTVNNGSHSLVVISR